MITLALQCLVAILTLAFGIAALRVTRVPSIHPGMHRAAWMMTGIVFTILGVSTAVQNCIGAPWAYFAGSGTPPYELFIRLSPVGNHSRNFLVVAYGAMMTLLVWLGRIGERRFIGMVLFASVSAMAAGAFVGWKEGPLVQSTHWTATAISDSVELVLLMAALFIGVVWNTTDRLLWVALVVFAVHELFDVAWYSALAWSDVEGAWHPPAKYIHLYASLAYIVMTAVAYRRARLARRGVKVSGLLDPQSDHFASLAQ